MTKLDLAKRTASIVVYGHIGLFMYGLLVMFVGGYDRMDTFQMILMGSPLLAMVALSAYRFMASIPAEDTSGMVDQSWAAMSTITSVVFLLALFAAYSVAMFNTSIKPDFLKIVVGAIETVLGAYLGVNRDTLFPDTNAS